MFHYRETLEARRARLGSKTIKTEGTLCSNGSYHAKTTVVKKAVTCPDCLKKLGINQEENVCELLS